MPHAAMTRLLFLLSPLLLSPVLATEPAAAPAGVTIRPALAIPARPIATREQLDAYVRDTPSANSPLSWLTPGARQRFLDSLVFHSRGLGGMNLDDLGYELDREQAYSVLQLFGMENYALDLDARSTPQPATGGSEASTLEPYYDQLVAVHPDDLAAQAQAIERIYATGFTPLQTDAHRRALGDRDAEFLFRAATLAFRVTRQPGYLADLGRDFAELERRHRVDRPHASNFYDVLLGAHHADEARALLARYPLIERSAPPSMRDANRIRSGQPSLWIATPGTRKRELVRFRFNIRAPMQVIVLASTGCHFSAKAARDIEADPLLSSLFREYGQWVAPPSEVTAFDSVRSWNQAHPALRIGIAQDLATLPMIGRIETPTFYFLDHGTVVDTVVGWPGEGNLDAIRRGFRKINLLH